MRYNIVQITAEVMYRGHKIETIESPIQVVYVVDGQRENAYWNMEEAKRAIDGQPLIWCPIYICHWFR